MANLYELFYAAITAMLDVNGKSAAAEHCTAARDYIDSFRHDPDNNSTATEADLLDSVLARTIELTIHEKHETDDFDRLIFILSKCNPEQYLYSFRNIISTTQIPRNQHSYRQVLIAAENLLDHSAFVYPHLKEMFDKLLGKIDIREIAFTYSTLTGHDSDLLSRINRKVSCLNQKR